MDRQEPLAPGFWQATDEGQDFSIDRSAAESSQSPADATGSSRSGAKAPALAGSKSARFAEFLIQFLFLISMLFLIHFNNKTSRKHSYCIFILFDDKNTARIFIIQPRLDAFKAHAASPKIIQRGALRKIPPVVV